MKLRVDEDKQQTKITKKKKLCLIAKKKIRVYIIGFNFYAINVKRPLVRMKVTIIGRYAKNKHQIVKKKLFILSKWDKKL